MDLLEKACTLVAETQHRYLVPDPARPLAIGDYGRVRNGMLIKRGSVQGWLDAKKIPLPDGWRVTGEMSKTKENSELKSEGVRTTSFVLDADLSAAMGNAKVGLKLAFSRGNQVYFHVPGLQFTGMKDMDVLGDTLVTCAKRDDHDPTFWEDDYCVVTGVYLVQSCLQIFAENASEEVGFTASGAASIQDLYKVGAKLAFTSQNSSSTVLKRTYESDEGAAAIFYEMHKVHWWVGGHKWWGVVEDANP